MQNYIEKHFYTRDDSKQLRYQRRMRAEGRCTKCGEDSKGFYDCDRCREVKNKRRRVTK